MIVYLTTILLKLILEAIPTRIQPFTNVAIIFRVSIQHDELYIEVQGMQVSNHVSVLNLTFRVRSQSNHGLELSSHEAGWSLELKTRNYIK